MHKRKESGVVIVGVVDCSSWVDWVGGVTLIKAGKKGGGASGSHRGDMSRCTLLYLWLIDDEAKKTK